MARDRNAMKQNLLKRTEEDYNRQGGGGGKYFRSDADFISFRPQPSKEPHIIDIVPYIVGSKQPPLAMEGKVRQGDDAYVLELEVHTSIGPGKQSILCPAKNYGKPCPICEHIEELIREGAEWEDYKAIAPKKRCLYNVINMTDAKQQAKGIQVWDVPYRYSQEKIKALAKNPRTGGFVIFQHPDADTGKSISFEVAKDTYRTIQGHQFLDRNYDIPDEILDKAHVLDELLEVMPYDNIKLIFEGPVEAGETKSVAAPGPNSSQSETTSEQSTTRRNRNVTTDTSNPCPKGFAFGVEIDKHDECQSCADDKYKACCEKADMLDAEAEAEKKRLAEEAAKASTGSGAPAGRRLLRRQS
jgi:hypothetical protein